MDPVKNNKPSDKSKPSSAANVSKNSGTSEAEPKPGSSKQHDSSKTLSEFYDKEFGGFAIYPRTNCPHLNLVHTVPKNLNIAAGCSECDSKKENWICLTCYTVHCSRFVKEHMVSHSISSSHPLALSISDISVWCYICDAYIDNKVLHAAKNVVHLAKFGHEMTAYYPTSIN